MRLPLVFALTLVAIPLAGCHSAHIEATISNRSGAPISLVEVDYPSASFGTENLPPGQDFHYRFKVLGSGPTSVLWTDAAHHDHKGTGPSLKESDEGNLTVTINPLDATWSLKLLKNGH